MTDVNEWYEDIPYTNNPDIPADVKKYVASAVTSFFATNDNLQKTASDTLDNANFYTDSQISQLVTFLLNGIDKTDPANLTIVKWDEEKANNGNMVQPYDVGDTIPDDPNASTGDYFIKSLVDAKLGTVEIYQNNGTEWQLINEATINTLSLFSIKKDNSGWYYDPSGKFNQSDFTIDLTNYYTKSEIDAIISNLSFISTVNHDDTLSGSGTISDPLSVVTEGTVTTGGSEEIWYGKNYNAGSNYFFVDYDLESNQTVVKFYDAILIGSLSTHPDNDPNLVLNRVFKLEKPFLSKHPVIANSNEINPYTGTNYTSDDCEVLVSPTDDVNAVITALLNIDYFNSELAPITLSKGTFGMYSKVDNSNNYKIIGAGTPQTITPNTTPSNSATYSNDGTILKQMFNNTSENTTFQWLTSPTTFTNIFMNLLVDGNKANYSTEQEFYGQGYGASTQHTGTIRMNNISIINYYSEGFEINNGTFSLDFNNSKDLQFYNNRGHGIAIAGTHSNSQFNNWKNITSSYNNSGGIAIAGTHIKTYLSIEANLYGNESANVYIRIDNPSSLACQSYFKFLGKATMISANTSNYSNIIISQSNDTSFAKSVIFDFSELIAISEGNFSSTSKIAIAFTVYRLSDSQFSNILIKAPTIDLTKATVGTKPVFYSNVGTSGLVYYADSKITKDSAGTTATRTKGSTNWSNELTM